MALGAIRPELRVVDVRVTIRAVLPYVCKDRFYVAFRAGNLFVQASERKPRRIMVEFRNRANRRPRRIRVAILAGNGKGAVRTPPGLPLGIRRAGGCQRQEHEEEQTTELESTGNDGLRTI